MNKRLNWRLLLGTAACVVVVGPLVYLAHHYQVKHNAATFLNQAGEAQPDGRTDEAVKLLHHYVTQVPKDGDGWAHYGLALDKLGTPASRAQAVAAYEQALRYQPARHDVR